MVVEIMVNRTQNCFCRIRAIDRTLLGNGATANACLQRCDVHNDGEGGFGRTDNQIMVGRCCAHTSFDAIHSFGQLKLYQ